MPKLVVGQKAAIENEPNRKKNAIDRGIDPNWPNNAGIFSVIFLVRLNKNY